MIIQHPEFHLLVSALMPFAHCMLQEHGEFLPFGGYMQSEDAIMLPPFAKAPSSMQEWLTGVKEALRREAAGAECAAVAICIDVKLTDTRDGSILDAVQLIFEHRSGEALEAFFPYKRQNDTCEFGQPMIRLGVPGLFPEQASAYLN